MTVETSVRKAGPYEGNGATIEFPFSFKVFSRDDVRVTFADEGGIESTLELDVDYAVQLNEDQEHEPGGVVTYPVSGPPLAAGERITLSGRLGYVQPTSITNQGGFYPRVIEDALDRIVMQVQQLAEQLSRTLTAPITGDFTADDILRQLEEQLPKVSAVYAELTNVIAVANNEANINIVADGVGAVVSVAGDLGGAWETGVMYDFGYVTDPPVGNTSPPGGNIVTVANSITDVSAVADDISNVNFVAGSIGHVNSVALNMDSVVNVENNETNINAVAGNKANIDAVANNETNINAAVANEGNINAAVANKNNINSVASNEVNINTVATNIVDVNSVGMNISDVNTAAQNISGINTVANIATDVSTVADNEIEVSAIGRDLTGQPIVIDYGDLGPVDNPASPAGVLGDIWSARSDIHDVSNDIDNIVYVAQNLAAILSALSGALVPANNLSELTDPAQARANLGLADLGGLN